MPDSYDALSLAAPEYKTRAKLKALPPRFVRQVEGQGERSEAT